MEEMLNNVIVNSVIVDIVINQLKVAEETIEYTSWLTASIFSVLGVFTIFLSHQYQNHTSELIKLIWNMKNNVLKMDKAEFTQNILDFDFFSKTPKVLSQAVKTSKVVIWILIPVWSIACFSMICKISMFKGQKHYLSMFLILVVTALFIFFSVKLLTILSKLSRTDEDGREITNVIELFNIKNLSIKNFNLNHFLVMDQVSWNFLILGEEPFTRVQVKSEYGVYNYLSLLYIDGLDHELYLSANINLKENNELPKENNLTLDAQQRVDLSRYFSHADIAQARISMIISFDEHYLYFKCSLEKEHHSYRIKIVESQPFIDLPEDIKEEFKRSEFICHAKWNNV
jgi:hypothetical protein